MIYLRGPAKRKYFFLITSETHVCPILFGVAGEQSSLHPHHSAFDEDPQVQGGCSQRQRQDVAHHHRHR